LSITVGSFILHLLMVISVAKVRRSCRVKEVLPYNPPVKIGCASCSSTTTVSAT
jgi:hypothetical protein